jgi:hypothetical protein
VERSLGECNPAAQRGVKRLRLEMRKILSLASRDEGGGRRAVVSTLSRRLRHLSLSMPGPLDLRPQTSKKSPAAGSATGLVHPHLNQGELGIVGARRDSLNAAPWLSTEYPRGSAGRRVLLTVW